jgi:cell division septation protein DedD
MNCVPRLALAAGLAFALSSSFAAPAALVEGVQMPAWLERDGARAPLAPGVELRSGDRLSTGAGSRLQLRLAEGSRVKLGENASLQLAQINPQREGVFMAALRVVEGAFRFTTDVLAKARRREVSIQVATVTAGIRGTDLWGKSAPERQIVCLIEGKVEVGAEGETPVTMDQPLQFYNRVKGQTQPVGFVSPEQLKRWSEETEIEAGKGAARRGGRWRVTLGSFDTQAAALALYDSVRAAGFAAEIRPAGTPERWIYHVRIAQLPTREEAEALAARLRGQHGVAEPKVSG